MPRLEKKVRGQHYSIRDYWEELHNTMDVLGEHVESGDLDGRDATRVFRGLCQSFLNAWDEEDRRWALKKMGRGKKPVLIAPAPAQSAS